MREQVIASRPPRRGAAKGLNQRPTRRDGRPEPGRFSVRALLGYVPTVLKIAFVLLAFIGLAIGYRVASSASLFQVRAVDVVGTSRTSSEEIEGLVRRAVSRTGVWRADLTAISNELGRLPGVRHAVVTRVLPDRVRVRITERVPIAVVRTSAGHFVWVDEDGVMLGEMKTTDQMPPFFIRGWNEDGTSDAGEENAERVKKYLEAVREWQNVGLTERISEINLVDVRDVRAQLAGKDSQIEVRLGAQELGDRLKKALTVLDEYRQTARGSLITYVDLQGDRVVVGFSGGSKTSADSSANEITAANDQPTNDQPKNSTPAPSPVPKPVAAKNSSPADDKKSPKQPTKKPGAPALHVR
jgi:cell division protein FtsQ